MGKRTRSAAPLPPKPQEIIRRRRRRVLDRESISGFFSRLVILILMLGFLFGVLFGLEPMQNNDMSPRISAGDLLLYYRMAEEWNNGDVMVFQQDGEHRVARIVARGGDTVEVTDQATLVVNGSTIIENDIFYSTPVYESSVTYPVTLAADEYFVLCDYREGAKESRYFGPVSADQILGKVITVVRRSDL